MAGGRPTKYKAEYAEQAYKFCLLGADDNRLATFFEVDVATINRWKESHPQFCESLKNGKEKADSEIAHALYHRAKGYSHKAVKIFNNQGEIITENYTEHYPPDTGAAMAWLKNRQPAHWRDKQDIEHTVNAIEVLKDDELHEGIEKTIRAITELSARIGTKS